MLGVVGGRRPYLVVWPGVLARWRRGAATRLAVSPVEEPGSGQAPAATVRQRAAEDADGAGSAGPHARVAALYQQHARAVLAYLYQRLPVLADAEDALAEVFVAALHACAADKALDLAWLLLVARRRIADFYRERERRATRVASAGMAETVAADARSEPEQQVLRTELRHELRRLIAALPPDQRDVLALRFAAGLRAPQIALLLGRSDEAVRALLSRAVRHLRKEWVR